MKTNSSTEKGSEITDGSLAQNLPANDQNIFEEMLQVASYSFIFLLEFHQQSCSSVAFHLEWMSVATLVDVVARETIPSFTKILNQNQTTYPLLARVAC